MRHLTTKHGRVCGKKAKKNVTKKRNENNFEKRNKC